MFAVPNNRERSSTRTDRAVLIRFPVTFHCGACNDCLGLVLDILHGDIGLHDQGDRLTGQGLDEDLHGTSTEAKDHVGGGLLLDVVRIVQSFF